MRFWVPVSGSGSVPLPSCYFGNNSPMEFLRTHVPSRGFEKGLAGGGWRPTAPKIQQTMSPRIVFSFSLGGIRKRGQQTGLDPWCGRDFLAPTPPVCQPLFETSDPSRVTVIQAESFQGICSIPFSCQSVTRKNPHAHKNKIGTSCDFHPPLPKNPNTPP